MERKNINRVAYTILISILFFNLLTLTSASTKVSACGHLDTAGEYYWLNQSLSAVGDCIHIGGNNVVFDLDGFSITGDIVSTGVGIHHDGGTNVSIINGTIIDFKTNAVYTVGNSHLLNLTLSNSNTPLYILGNNAKIENTTIYNCTSATSALVRTDGDNIIFDNVIMNLSAEDCVYDYSQVNNTYNNVQCSNAARYGLYFENGINHTISNSIVYNNGYGLRSYSNPVTTGVNFFINNFTSHDNNRGVSLEGYSNTIGANSNTFLNLNVYNNNISVFDSVTSLTDKFIYNNSNGQIQFTSSAFLNNLTVLGNISFPGTTFRINNNDINLNLSDLKIGGKLYNSSANITLFNLPTDTRIPKIFSGSSICTTCSNFTSLNAGTVIFNISNWDTNYSIQETGEFVFPLISYNISTEVSGSFLNRSNIIVNVSAYDANLLNIKIYLSNITGIMNTSLNNSASPFSIKFLNLNDGLYFFNASACDTSSNCNWTETRNVTLDTTYPQINEIFPQNISYNINISELNYTVSDTNLQSCWYSTDGGTTNTTITCGNNVTGLTSTEGSNTWTIWANDSASNINSSSVTFFKDTIYPQINIVIPLSNASNQSSSELNYTVSDTNLQSCWYSTDGGTTNTTVTCGNNITGLTSNFGYNTWTIWANDSVNNINSSSVTFIYWDTLVVVLNYPLNNSWSNSLLNTFNFTIISGGTSLINWTFYLNGAVNDSGSCTGLVSLNSTTQLLKEGNYNWTVQLIDNFTNNIFADSNFTFTIDTTFPRISFVSPTLPSNSTTTENHLININVSVVENNKKSTSIYLFDKNRVLINSSNSSSETFTVPNGLYYYNATTCDLANNCNSTETRQITIFHTDPGSGSPGGGGSIQCNSFCSLRGFFDGYNGNCYGIKPNEKYTSGCCCYNMLSKSPDSNLTIPEIFAISGEPNLAPNSDFFTKNKLWILLALLGIGTYLFLKKK